MWLSLNNSLSLANMQLYHLVLQLVSKGSVFYYNPAGLQCGWQQNLSEQPQWSWNTHQPYSKLKQQHNSEIFVVACLPESYESTQLLALATSLDHLREVRIIIELASNPQSATFNESQVATKLFTFCLQHSLLNVLLYFQRSTESIYGFEAFPQLTISKRAVHNSSTAWFPNKLVNLKGAQFKLMPDLFEPRTIVYYAPDGQKQLRGFLWHFIETFANKHQAKINVLYPTWPTGRYLEPAYLLALTNNGSIDLGLAASPIQYELQQRPYQYSYPLLQGSRCVMLPMEALIESHAVCAHMCDLKALALFLATCASAAALVRTETVRLSNYWHCLKLLPLLLLLLAACICPAVYSSLMVRPPHKAVIADFDELLASDVHVMLVRSAFEHFPADFRAQYAAAFRLTENVTNLLTMRSSYNTNWGYLVSTFNWLVVQQQQQHFQQPLFRYSDLCMHRLAHYSAILGENSIYRQALDLHIMRTQQSGLLKHWLKHSFYDLVKTGRMQLKDYSSKRMRWPLRVQDLRTSFICLLAGLSLAFFCVAA